MRWKKRKTSHGDWDPEISTRVFSTNAHVVWSSVSLFWLVRCEGVRVKRKLEASPCCAASTKESRKAVAAAFGSGARDWPRQPKGGLGLERTIKL